MALTRYEAEEFISALVKVRRMVTDEQACEVQVLYPVWQADMALATGERVLHNDVLYKVLTAHTSQANWTPDAAVSLFAKVLIPDENVIYPWEKPESTNPYMRGDKVTHNGKTWVSNADYNVWEPGVYGWDEVTE